jgi:FkbM family methyltransferase
MLSKKLKVIGSHYKIMGVRNASSYIIQRLYKKKRLLSAKIKNTKLEIYLRNNRYDTQIFTQIFMRSELDIHFKEDPEIIIDGGANIGLATLYLKNKYPKAKIIAVEPEPSNFELLLKNTKNYKDIFCLRNGIWNRNCQLQIIDNGDGNASFITKEVPGTERVKNAINAITITDIMNQFKIGRLDLLKLDIEGSEKNVFEKNYKDWLKNTQNIIIEIHPHLQPNADAIITAVLSNEFKKIAAGEYYFFSRKHQLQ